MFSYRIICAAIGFSVHENGKLPGSLTHPLTLPLLHPLTHFPSLPPSLFQVGSFEEVLMRMTASEGSELAAWSQVMFVAPGLLQAANQGPGGRLLEPVAAATAAATAGSKK